MKRKEDGSKEEEKDKMGKEQKGEVQKDTRRKQEMKR